MFYVRRILTQASLSGFAKKKLINNYIYQETNINKIIYLNYSSIKQENKEKFKSDASTVILSDSCVKVNDYLTLN